MVVVERPKYWSKFLGERVQAGLQAWRDAERRWERTSPDDPSYISVRDEVLARWLQYQEAAGSIADDEVVLVVDDAMRYIAANETAHRLLGYEAGHIIGKSITDLTPPADADVTARLWDEFRIAGRQDGDYVLCAKDGKRLPMRYTARAHFPVANLHTSKLRPVSAATRAT
jgi:PAS domain S-box-containing protein